MRTCEVCNCELMDDELGICDNCKASIVLNEDMDLF